MKCQCLSSLAPTIDKYFTMKNLNKIAEELFNQIRSRFSNVTLGDENAEVVNEPNTARYFDFVYSENDNSIGNVSVSLDEEEGLVVMFSNNFGEDVQDFQKDNWYNFLKELRTFAKKRLLNFEVRDINKSSLQRRDYKTLANNRSGEQTMAESKMYGTHKTSFQKVGNAKIAIKHTGTLDEGENRTKKIGAIYVENNQGEKFKYPFKHLAGARAMALHVSEGGHPFDDFGKHITSLSEELSNLRKFKTYMGRSSVMAESLAEHLGTVNERIANVKKTIQNLQKPNYYKETFENFVAEESVQVPEDVAANWIDQLTVKQFNEELKDVFPYIYKLIGESTKPQELTFEDIINEDDQRVKVLPGEKDLQMLAKRFSVPPAKMQQFMDDMIEVNGLDDVSLVGVKEVIVPSAYAGGNNSNVGSREVAPNGQVTGSTRGFDTDNDYFNPRAGQQDQPDYPGNKGLADAIEYAVETLMGQFAAQINEDEETDEGNAYAHAVRKAKMNGKKKGDKIDGPDGDEITIEKDQKTPLGEFILSYFDKETGQFPKGPTAVLTMVEKNYGDEYVGQAKEFIERIDAKVAEVMGYRESDMDESRVGTAIRKFGDIRKSGNEKGAKAGYFSYIYDLDDATAVLGHLRKRAKIDGTTAGGAEKGKDARFQNDYITLTYNVGDYLRNITDNFTHKATPPGLKAALDDMFKVRGMYKRAETGGEKAYSSQAIDPLYGVMLQIDDLAYNARRMEESVQDLHRIKNLAGM